MLVFRDIFISACSVLLGLALFVLPKTLFLLVSVGMLFLILLAFELFTLIRGKRHNGDLFLIVITPLLFFLAIFALRLFSESLITSLALALLLGFVNRAYFTNWFYFLHVPGRYTPNSIESVSWSMHLVSIFGISAALYGVYIFIRPPFLALLLPFVPLMFLLAFHAFWIAKQDERRVLLLSSVGTLLLSELFVIGFFLPTSFYVNGALLTLAAYIVFALFRVPADADFQMRRALRPMFFVFFLLFFLLTVSAPWR